MVVKIEEEKAKAISIYECMVQIENKNEKENCSTYLLSLI